MARQTLMPKGPLGQKNKLPKSKKLPRKLAEDPVSGAEHIVREATKQDVGNVADKITPAPKRPSADYSFFVSADRRFILEMNTFR
jgi:hypothetical protein